CPQPSPATGPCRGTPSRPAFPSPCACQTTYAAPCTPAKAGVQSKTKNGAVSPPGPRPPPGNGLVLRALHDLGQDAAHVLGVDEEDERPVRADARLAEDASAFGLEFGLGRVDLGHLEADVMLPAERVLLEELHNRRIRTQRFDQLDLAIGGVDEADPYALCRKVERLAMRLGAEHVAVELEAPLDRRRRHADMVEAAEFHSVSPSC